MPAPAAETSAVLIEPGERSISMVIAQAHSFPASSSTFHSEGLPWVQQMSYHMQGRLAGCHNIAGALEVLDEVLLGMPLPASKSESFSQTDVLKCGGDDGVVTSDDGVVARERSGHGRWGRHQAQSLCQEPPRARRGNNSSKEADLVAASAEILRAARSRVAGLEEELHQRQHRHDQQVAQLCRKQRRDRRRALGCLLDRLSPPGRQQQHQQSSSPQPRGHSEVASPDASLRQRGHGCPDASLEFMSVPVLPSYGGALRQDQSRRSPAANGVSQLGTRGHSAPNGSRSRGADNGMHDLSADGPAVPCTDTSGTERCIESAQHF